MRQKKQRIVSKKNMIGLFIVLIMVMSGIGFVIMQNPGTDSSAAYNGFEFFSPSFGTWYTKIGERDVRFTYHPSEVESVPIQGDSVNYLLNTKMAYITFDPDDANTPEIELARLELENELPKSIGLFPVTGVTEAKGAYSAFPEVDCENGTLFVPVIMIRTDEEADEATIRSEGPCIILEGRSARDIQALKDRLLYGIYGIIV